MFQTEKSIRTPDQPAINFTSVSLGAQTRYWFLYYLCNRFFARYQWWTPGRGSRRAITTLRKNCYIADDIKARFIAVFPPFWRPRGGGPYVDFGRKDFRFVAKHYTHNAITLQLNGVQILFGFRSPTNRLLEIFIEQQQQHITKVNKAGGRRPTGTDRIVSLWPTATSLLNPNKNKTQRVAKIPFRFSAIDRPPI